jgi:hypothetical protein
MSPTRFSFQQRNIGVTVRVKFIVTLLMAQFVLSQLMIVRDAASPGDFVQAYLWSSLGSLVAGLILLSG